MTYTSLNIKFNGPSWACADCGSTDKFENVVYDTPGEPLEYDIRCVACGSTNVDESIEEALHNMALVKDTLEARCETLEKDLERASGFREGHPGMCCGQCTDSIIAAESERDKAYRAVAAYEEKLAAAEARCAELEKSYREYKDAAYSLADQKHYWKRRAEKLDVALRLCDLFCEHLHHDKRHRHKSGEPCPVEAKVLDALKVYP